MTRRRRALLALTAGLGVASLIAACSGPADSTSTDSANPGQEFAGQTLTWAINPVSANQDAFDKLYDTIAEKFKEATGATLKYQPNQTSGSSIDQLIAQMAATGAGPDMISTGTTKIPAAYESGVFHEFTDAEWQEMGGKDQFYPNALTIGGPDEQHIVGVPRFSFPYVMAYNTKLFEEAGITEPPTTWDEFIADAQKINDPENGVYGTTMQPADDVAAWTSLYWYIKELGGDYISEDLTNAQLDTDPVKEAMTFWWDWNQKYKVVDPNSLNWNRAQADAAFADGKVGMEIVVSTAQIPIYKAGAVGTDFAFTPVPEIPMGMTSLPPGGVAPGTFVSGHMIVVADYANVPLAVQFLKLYLSPEIQKLQYDTVGYLPAVKAVGDEYQKADPLLAPFFEVMNTQVSTPFSAAFPTVQSAIASSAAQIAAQIAENGSASPEFIGKTLDDANVVVQEQIDQLG